MLVDYMLHSKRKLDKKCTIRFRKNYDNNVTVHHFDVLCQNYQHVCTSLITISCMSIVPRWDIESRKTFQVK